MKAFLAALLFLLAPSASAVMTSITASPDPLLAANGEIGNVCVRLKGTTAMERTKTELIFVVDESGSIRDQKFKQLKNKLKAFVHKISDELHFFDGGKGRVGIVTFSEDAHLDLSLDHGTTKYLVTNAIDHIRFADGKQTRTDLGLNRAAHEFVENAHPGATKVLIIFTDGNPFPKRFEQKALDEAKDLRENDVEIFAVGIDNNIDFKFLKQLTGESDRSRVSRVNFNGIEGALAGFLKVIEELPGNTKIHLDLELAEPLVPSYPEVRRAKDDHVPFTSMNDHDFESVDFHPTIDYKTVSLKDFDLDKRTVELCYKITAHPCKKRTDGHIDEVHYDISYADHQHTHVDFDDASLDLVCDPIRAECFADHPDELTDGTTTIDIHKPEQFFGKLPPNTKKCDRPKVFFKGTGRARRFIQNQINTDKNKRLKFEPTKSNRRTKEIVNEICEGNFGGDIVIPFFLRNCEKSPLGEHKRSRCILASAHCAASDPLA